MHKDGQRTWQRTSSSDKWTRDTGNKVSRPDGALRYEPVAGAHGSVYDAIRSLATHAADNQKFVQMEWNGRVVEVAPAPRGNKAAQDINAEAAIRSWDRNVAAK